LGVVADTETHHRAIPHVSPGPVLYNHEITRMVGQEINAAGDHEVEIQVNQVAFDAVEVWLKQGEFVPVPNEAIYPQR
jgi:hypothetical protein